MFLKINKAIEREIDLLWLYVIKYVLSSKLLDFGGQLFSGGQNISEVFLRGGMGIVWIFMGTQPNPFYFTFRTNFLCGVSWS